MELQTKIFIGALIAISILAYYIFTKYYDERTERRIIQCNLESLQQENEIDYTDLFDLSENRYFCGITPSQKLQLEKSKGQFTLNEMQQFQHFIEAGFKSYQMELDTVYNPHHNVSPSKHAKKYCLWNFLTIKEFLKSNSLDNLIKNISSWQKHQFNNGETHVEHILPMMHHLKEETDELITATQQFLQTGNSENLKTEISDAFILLLGSIDLLGINEKELLKIVHNKMEVNRNRRWSKPNKNGVCNHLENVNTNEIPKTKPKTIETGDLITCVNDTLQPLTRFNTYKVIDAFTDNNNSQHVTINNDHEQIDVYPSNRFIKN